MNLGSFLAALALGFVAGAIARALIPNDAFRHMHGWRSWLTSASLGYGAIIILRMRHFYVSKKSHSLPSTQRRVASFPLMYPYSHASSWPGPMGFQRESRPYLSSTR